MTRIVSFLLISFLALAACTDTSGTTALGADGRPLPTVYKIRGNPEKLQYRMLDSVNALRQSSGLQPVQLNAQLNAAAATHSKDMSRQNRPWHFGSDGSSPLDRAQRVGYYGTFLGEAISETLRNRNRNPGRLDAGTGAAVGHHGPESDADGLFLASGRRRQDLVDS